MRAIYIVGLGLVVAAAGCNRLGGGGDTSPLDSLDPSAIPAAERRDGHPDGLVAVLAPDAKARGFGSFVSALAFHPSGRWLVSVHAGPEGERRTRVWDLSKPGPAHDSGVADDRFVSVAFAPDGKLVAFGQELVHGVVLADFRDGRLAERRTRLADAPKGRGAARPVAFTPDGTALFTGPGGFDKTVRLWAAGDDALKLKASIQFPAFVTGASLASDGKTAAASCNDKTVRLCDLAADPPAERAALTHAAAVESVAFTPDGKTLAAGCADQSVWLWDLAKDPAQVKAKLAGHAAGVTAVEFSPDGLHLLSADRNGRVVLWTAAGEKVREWPSSIPAAFAPDGRHVALGGYANSIYIVRLPAAGR